MTMRSIVLIAVRNWIGVEMSDLIKRGDAIEALYEAIRTDFKGTFKDSMSLAIEMGNNIPSAEPERKKGEWRHLGGDEWCCSNCGYVVSTEGAWEHPKEQGKDYCEHCGSDMRSEYE